MRHNRRGAAAVEFACILPVFMLIFVSMIEFGRGLMALTSLTNAAREGSRHAVLRTASLQSTKDVVNQHLQSANLRDCTITISPAPEQAQPGNLISIDVSVPYSSISWIVSGRFLDGRVLHSQVTMQKE